MISTGLYQRSIFQNFNYLIRSNYIIENSMKPLVVFDFDGVIIDSEKLSLEAIHHTLENFKIDLSKESIKDKYRGWQFSKIADDLNICKSKSSVFQQQVIGYLNSNIHKMTIIEGIEDLLDKLKRNKINYCITSNASVDRINQILINKNISYFFKDKMIFGKELANKGKPAPDIYNLTMQHFKSDYDRFIAIEDSIAGIMAASSAKINNIVGFIDGDSQITPSEMKEIGCTNIIHNINEFYPMFFS